MRLKLYLVGVLMVLGLGVSTPARAQLVVSDPGSMAQRTLQWIKEAEEFATQLAKMKLQYDMLKDAYDAATGARNLGDVFDNPLLRQYLPQGWVQIYDAV